MRLPPQTALREMVSDPTNLTARRLGAPWLVFWAALLPGCGGSNYSTTPTEPDPAPLSGGIRAGAPLTVVSGETDRPVAGASIVVGTTRYTTDSGGRVLLTEDVAYGAPVDINAGEFLPRQTTLQPLGARFSLWPRRGVAGFDETSTQELIYTSGVRCCPIRGGGLGVDPLLRMRTGRRASVGLPTTDLGAGLTAAIGNGIDLANAAADGRVGFSLTSSSNPDVRIIVERTGMTPDGRPAAAYFSASFESGWIVGGDLVLTASRFTPGGLARTVAHELGHCMGLGHTSLPGGIMTVVDRGFDFSPGELALLQLAYRRPAGNLYPDRDRHLSGSQARGKQLMCVLPSIR